jgi:G3E family GTPase
MTASIPVNVLTGFLGSGKTTLLRHLLAAPELADTAVLINEFGEVGLDHLLVERVDEGIVLLQSGCICCTIRGDLSRSIGELYSRRERGAVPRFGRLAIETTGLADPTPILSTVLHDPVLRHHFHLGNVVATVDGVNGLANLEEHEETAKQAAVADRLVLTKTDLAEPAAVATLRAALRRLNPSAELLEAVHGQIDAGRVLGEEAWREETRSAEVGRWLAAEAGASADHHDDQGHSPDRNRHGDIRAFVLSLDRPIDWATFGIWLTLLLHRHGNDILRVKGVLNVAGSDRPVVVQGVQHLVHRPQHLEAWPFGDRRSRLVFIARRVDEEAVRASLECFQALGAVTGGA